MKKVLYIFSFCFISCKAFVDVPSPDTKVGADVVFSNDATATSSVVGLYNKMMSTDLTIFNGASTIYPALSADELAGTTANIAFDAYTTNSLTSDNSVLAAFWSNAYNFIYQANACIEGITKSNGISDPTKARLLGEAKFCRALSYFYLINIFGNVPLITSTDYALNLTKSRDSSSVIYTQIIADLKEAKNSLSETYPTTDKVRPNKWTAGALLARTYLYIQDWANAETEASQVISSGLYSLPTDLNSVFLKASPETIWQLASVSSTLNTSEANQFIPSTSASSKPKFALTSSLLSSFEGTDQRKAKWSVTKTISGQPYVYPYKYKTKTGSAPYAEYNIMFRLAELYLIRAEARTQQNINLADAKTDLNAVRLRAGLSSTAASDKTSILAAIEQENRIEFFCELGHRWFDLKRNSHADAVLGPLKGTNWQSTDELYPIPYSQITINTNLKQNPGYNP